MGKYSGRELVWSVEVTISLVQIHVSIYWCTFCVHETNRNDVPAKLADGMTHWTVKVDSVMLSKKNPPSAYRKLLKRVRSPNKLAADS